VRDIGQKPSRQVVVRTELPVDLRGKSITWDRDYAPDPVFLAEWQGANGDQDLTMLFAAKLDFLRSSRRDATSVMMFQVVWTGDERPRARLLLQRDDVVFTEEGASTSWVLASGMKGQRSVAVVLPRWVSLAGAVWPTERGGLMRYVGAVDIPAGVHLDALVGARRVLLFATQDDAGRRFAVVTQDLSGQTPESHDRLTERDDRS
jgi:hypothetical protein